VGDLRDLLVQMGATLPAEMGGPTLIASNRRKSKQGGRAGAERSAGKAVVILEQHIDTLTPDERQQLTARGAGGPALPFADRTWIFDCISYFEVQPVAEYQKAVIGVRPST